MSVAPIDFELALMWGRAACLVFSFVIATIACIRWRHAAARDAERITTQLSALADQLGEIEAGLAALDSRIGEFARHAETPIKSAPAASPGASPSYPIAIRLARNGASCDDLMESCGLSRQEAELVRRLHAPSKHSARAQPAAA